MLTAKLGKNIINCYDGEHNRDTLKRWSDKNILLCSVCENPYEYCHGRVISPYFRHKDKEECLTKYCEPETEEHINGKIALYNWVKTLDGVTDAILEGWIPETKQRPDIMFKMNGKHYVIEYQCSPISSEYIKRHELYQAAGIYDIWILGTDKYIEKSEVRKNFRKKEIEKHTDYYYDSEYKIFAFSRKNIQFEYCKSVGYNSYFNKDSRLKISLSTISNDNFFFYTKLSALELDGKQFCINSDVIEEMRVEYLNYQNQQIEIEKRENICLTFIQTLSKRLEDLFGLYIGDMPTVNFGFKNNGHYYCLFNIENFPVVNFCKIDYMDNSLVKNKKLEFNIEKENDIYKIINFLSKDLAEAIKKKEDEINKYENLLTELSNYSRKPTYLLFAEDSIKYNNNIRFIHFTDYNDDLFKIGKTLLNHLKFFDKINSKYHTFLIPRNKWRLSSTGHSCYKVKNWKSDVVSDFKKLGFSVFGIKELNNLLGVSNY